MFSSIFKRLTGRPFYFHFARSYSTNKLTAPVFEQDPMGWVVSLLLGYVGSLAFVSNFIPNGVEFSFSNTLMVLGGTVASALLYGTGAWLLRRSARSVTKVVGHFFAPELFRIDGMLNEANDRLDALDLSANSEPKSLLLSARDAFNQAVITASALYSELAKYNPELLARYSDDLRYWQIPDDFKARLMKTAPLELQAQVEIFLKSLDTFSDFEKAFKVSLDCAAKPKIVVPSISNFLDASSSLSAKVSDASLHAEIDASARAELEDFMAMKVKLKSSDAGSASDLTKKDPLR